MPTIFCCLIMLVPTGLTPVVDEQPASANQPASESTEDKLVIVSAVYGHFETSATKDVTRLVRQKLKGNSLRFDVNNDILGDPAEGEGKTLAVKFQLNGKDQETKTPEGDTLLLPTSKLKGKLEVVKAEYGDLLNDEVYDVTRQVQQMVSKNSLEVDVSNDWFGDPASGTMKRLKVTYKIGDVLLTRTRWEESTLTIDVPSPKEAPEAMAVDGKLLAGWKVDPAEKTADHWSVVDGTIVAENKDKAGSNLWTTKQYRDYEMELEYRAFTDDYDTGVFLRGDGHQVQIGISGSLKKDMTACVYAPKDKKGGYPGQTDKIAEFHKVGKWNHLRIVLTGKRIQTFLNGEPFVDYTGIAINDAGPIGLQLHPNRAMKVAFRNIIIQEQKTAE